MDTTSAYRHYDDTRTGYSTIALPIVVWMLAVAVANPLGNFPLEDDWSYSEAVRRMVELHTFHPLGWTSMSLFGQTVWGALFSLPFGFSHFAARVSTIVAGALGLAACASLLQQLGCERRKTMFATVVFGFNPIYFVLSSTFMTDVSFTATSVFSILFFARYLMERRMTSLLAAMFFGLWATSIRQPGLFLPIAMFLTAVAVAPRKRGLLLVTGINVIVNWGFLKGLNAWMIAHGTLPAVYLDSVNLFARLLPDGHITTHSLSHLAGQMFWYFRGALEFVGWSVFPLIAWRLPSLVRDYARRPFGKLVLAGGVICCALWFVSQVAGHNLLPFNTWTTIHPAGLGPIWLPDARAGYDVPSLGTPFWLFVTFMGVFGASALVLDLALSVGEIVGAYRGKTRTARLDVRVFMLVCMVVYIVPFIVFGHYDRYLLPLVPLAIFLLMTDGRAAFASRSTQPPRTASRGDAVSLSLAALGFVVTAGFAVAGTHDYLNWNRARWMLIDTLFAHGVAANRVDGGYEFNGLYLYDPKLDTGTATRSWWIVDDEYRVQFQMTPGYKVVDRADARGWLPPLRRDIFTLRREGF